MKNTEVFRMMCGDFFRRQRVIKEGKAHLGVIIAYTLINEQILMALNEVYLQSGCFHPDIRKVLLHDIATNTGYEHSQLRGVIGEATYKKYKRKAKEELLKLLQI